eukprot:381487-Amphidinium_carterae.1
MSMSEAREHVFFVREGRVHLQHLQITGSTQPRQAAIGVIGDTSWLTMSNCFLHRIDEGSNDSGCCANECRRVRVALVRKNKQLNCKFDMIFSRMLRKTAKIVGL